MIEASAKNPAGMINGLGEKACDDSAYMVARGKYRREGH